MFYKSVETYDLFEFRSLDLLRFSWAVTSVVRGSGGVDECCHWPWFARVVGFAFWSYI